MLLSLPAKEKLSNERGGSGKFSCGRIKNDVAKEMLLMFINTVNKMV